MDNRFIANYLLEGFDTSKHKVEDMEIFFQVEDDDYGTLHYTTPNESGFYKIYFEPKKGAYGFTQPISKEKLRKVFELIDSDSPYTICKEGLNKILAIV